MSRSELEAELARLRQRESLLEATERVARVGHYEWDYARDRLKSCSEAYATIFGMSVAEVMQSQIGWERSLNFIHVDDRSHYRDFAKKLNHRQSLEIEYRILRGSGEIRYIRETGIEITDAEGKMKSLFGMLQDLTDQWHYRKALEYRESLTLQVERITDIGNFVYDENADCYLYASPGCARIFGVSEQEFIDIVDSVDEDLADIHVEDRERVLEVYRSYFNNAEDCNVDYRVYHPDGGIRWIRELLVADEIKNGRVSLTHGVLMDITRQKTSELELIEAKNNLAQQVESRTCELASTVSQLEAEVEERRSIAAELDFLANHDALTGLPSLRLCKDRLERSLAAARRNQQLAAVMFIDLDGFKGINDSYGHEFGDQVLKISADRIKAEIRETDTVARIGGDEFLVILTSLPQMDVANRIAASLVEQISQAINIEQNRIVIGASIGIAIYPLDGTSSEELIRKADKAMYLVKHGGKGNFGFAHDIRLN